MSPDKYFTATVSDKISGEDDLDDLEKNGKGLVVKERAVYIPPKIYCTRCLKGHHNISENDQRCLGSRKKGRSDCQCPCQTHYVGRDGRLRKYNTPDDSNLNDDAKTSPESDAEFEKLQDQLRKLHPSTIHTVQEKDEQWYKDNGVKPPQKKERMI
jgi:hypothetical protein